MIKARKRPILVSGSHRSGSTWTGKTIDLSYDTFYIDEPFHYGMKRSKSPLKGWFDHVSSESTEKEQEAYFDFINRMLYEGLGDDISNVRGFRSLFHFFKLRSNKSKKRPIMKDPIAFFSAEWLVEKFDMQVIMCIRHPAAFAGSLKKQNWTFDFNQFLQQPLLMKNFLQPFEAEIKKFSEKEHDIIDQSILLWNCIHHTIKIYQEKHPNWYYVRHEDLSRRPMAEFKKIYDYLDLAYHGDLTKHIMDHTSIENLQEDIAQKIENTYTWRKRLTEDEINKVKEGTKVIANHFYTEEDWKYKPFKIEKIDFKYSNEEIKKRYVPEPYVEKSTYTGKLNKSN